MATGGLERAVGMALALKILEMLLGQKEEEDSGGGLQDMMMLGMLGQLAGGRESSGLTMSFERSASTSHTTIMPTDAVASYESTSMSVSTQSLDLSA